MTLLRRMDFVGSRIIARAPAWVYNPARSVRFAVDKREIRKYKKRGVPFTLVYQQGRVASTSVYESICDLNLPSPTYHVHYLSKDDNDSTDLKLHSLHQRIHRHTMLGPYLGTAIRDIRSQKEHLPWNIVTVFRDPIAQMLSLLFLDTRKSFGDLIQADGTMSRQALLERIQDMMNHDDPEGWAACNWFQHGFGRELGVDVYRQPFDRLAGYSVQKTTHFNILLLRFEDLATAFTRGCAMLFGLPEQRISLRNSRVHQDVRHREDYEFVKKNLQVSVAACKRIYATKMVRHFYSAEGISALMDKWTAAPR